MNRKSEPEAAAEGPAVETSSPEPGDPVLGPAAPRENGTGIAKPTLPADAPFHPPPPDQGEPSPAPAEPPPQQAEEPAPSRGEGPAAVEERPQPDGEPSAVEAAPGAPLAFVPPVADLSPLELRVRRLEEAVAALQEGRAREGRITAPPSAPPPRPRSGEVPRPAVPSPPPSASIPTAVPAIPISPPPAAIQTAPSAARARRRWLLWEIVAEFRVIVRMYADPRYAMTWTARLVPLALAFLIITSGFWGPWSYIPLLGWFLDKCVNLVMAFVLFKVLGHEARRYRETSPDLPPSLRL